MAEFITIKSRAREIYDYHQVDISQFLTGFVPDERQLNKDMTRWLRRYGKTISVEQVEVGDTAVLRCHSALPRFEKPSITVPVGKGLFDKELESQFAGMSVGESRTLFKGDTSVEVTLLSASRVQLPALTDEAIGALGVEEIQSVKELRTLCLSKQVEGFLLEDENPDMASAYVWQEVAKNSRFERDEEECRLVDILAENRLKEVQAQYGQMDPEEQEELSEEEKAEMASPSADDFTVDTFRQVFLTELDLATIGQEILRQENALLTVEDYEARLNKLQEAYPDKTRQQLMEQESPFRFAADYYADVLAQRIDAYVGQRFKAHFAR